MFIGGPVALFTVVLCGVTEKPRKPLKNRHTTELFFRAFVESMAGILVVSNNFTIYFFAACLESDVPCLDIMPTSEGICATAAGATAGVGELLFAALEASVWLN